ncbi:MAG TPA: sulfurtransferase [Candidatus Limnocylindrales bacterium]|nr:sulfurtransferase [Candidatus Limnocylindrales bacterium]
MTGYARPEILATTDWLAETLRRGEIRIIDARWRPDGSGLAVHARGHIPGAVHVDWTVDLVELDDETGVVRLAGPERVGAAIRATGISDGMTVIVYDDTNGLHAARVWWTLRAYGLDSARILDGGYPAWIAEELPVSNASALPQPGSFTPRAQLRATLATSDVRLLLGSDSVVLADARAPAEYLGHEGTSRRLGHIPGAVNLPAGYLTSPGGQRLRPASELRSILSKAGLARTGRRIVCYDASGVGAARLAFVLLLMGHDDVAVYDGGWAEWGERLDLPVDR